jgi:hypothetical protein
LGLLASNTLMTVSNSIYCSSLNLTWCGDTSFNSFSHSIIAIGHDLEASKNDISIWDILSEFDDEQDEEMIGFIEEYMEIPFIVPP